MIGKNNEYLKNTKEGTKVETYSIKKFKVGAASVVIGASIFFGAGAVAQASEEVSDNTTSDNTTNAGNGRAQKASAATAKPVAKDTTKEDVAAAVAAKAGEKVALDTTKLEKYIAEIEAKLADGTYANKTEESVAVLKADLEAAKATLRNAKTQDEITKAYSKLVTTANTKLKTKPVEKKETPEVDTTNGKETVGKKAENTEPKAGTNSIENTGSHDLRNGKLMENGSGFRAAVTPEHEEFTRTVGDITYSVEFSDDNLKEIYVYNKEEANVEFKIKSATNKVNYVETTKGSSQKFNTVDENTVTDGYGYYFKKITTDTDTPLTVAMTGQPNAGIMANASYTKTEDQNFAMGDRYLRVTAKNGTEMSSPDNGVDKAGYFKIVLKSQTYKYQPKNLTNADKVLVANPNRLTATELEAVKNSLKVIYSTTSTDARLASLKGTDVTDTYSVVDTITEEGKNFVVTYKDGSKDTVSKGLLVKSGPAPTVDTDSRARGTVLSTDEKLSGTGVVGATVKVTVRNPEKTEVLLEKTATVNAEGKWEIPLTEGLNSNEALNGGSTASRTFYKNKPKNPVEIIQTVDGIESEAKNQEVSIGPSTIKPSAAAKDGASVVAGAKEVTITVPHDAGFTYFFYTNKDNNKETQLDIKREDDGSLVMSGGNANKADIKKVEKGPFYDTVTLTLKEHVKEGVNLKVISHNGVATKGTYLGKTPYPVTNEAPVVSAVEENKNEKEVPTDASVTKADLLRLVKVTDHEDDLNATLGTKGNARIVSIDGDENATKVDTSTAGEHTVIFRAVDSQGKESADYTYKVKVRQNNAPEVTIPYSIEGKKDVYVYANEDFEIPIKYTDDTGKVVEASIRQGGNRELPQKAGQNDPNVLDNQYNMTVGKISTETTATAENPAIIKIKGNISKDNSGIDASKFPKEEDQELKIVTRYATATDTDGKNIFNNATETTYATDPGAFTIKLKAQTAKYDVKALDDEHKIVVTNTATLTSDDLVAVKKNLQLEFSKKNKDKNIDKTAEVTPENVGKAVDAVAQEGTNLVVTYKDGSKDTIALDKVVKLDKVPAIKAVNDKATEQIKAINDNNGLSQAEKDAAVAKVNEAKQAALDKIDDATNAADVTTAGTDGATAVGKVNPVAKDEAKKAVQDALNAKKDALDKRTDLSDAEKEAAKAKAKKAADDAIAEIDKQPAIVDSKDKATAAQTAVDGEKTKATEAIAKVNPIAKQAALDKIDAALKAKEKEMDGRADLTDEEKTAAKEEAKRIAEAKKAEINAKANNADTTEEAERIQGEINTAGTDGERDITAVTKNAAKKPAAKDSLTGVADTKKEEIKNDPSLSATAKEKLKEEVDAIKKASEAAIDGAKKDADVDDAKRAGEFAIKAINSVRLPANKVLVADKGDLSATDRENIEAAVRKVNPKATSIIVNQDGSVNVRLESGKEETLPLDKLVRTNTDLGNKGGGNDINRPMDKVIVKDPDPKKLTDAEKEKILKAVRDVNPNSVVTMDDNGTVTVSTPAGATAGFPVAELVRTLDDVKNDNSGSANAGIRKPADKVVGDPTNADDQAKVTAKLKKLNGDAAKVQYDAKGNATVVLPNGTVATIPASDLFKTPEEAKKVNGGDDINKPNSQTVVDDITTLQPDKLQEVKAEIKAKVEAVNPGAVVVVDDKGNAIVTTPEGKTAVIDADDLIKKSTELPNAKAGNYINNPADRVRVGNKESLQPEEIAKIKAAVEAVNPGATVVVDEKGNATVTTPVAPGVEAKTATIPVSELVKLDGDKTAVSGGNQVNTPADRVVLEKAIADLTPDELTKLKEDITAKVKAVNPDKDGKETTVVIDEKGNATVTTPDGKTATIPVADLVKAKTDLADPTKQDAVNKPADKVVVADPNADLGASKDAIKAAVEAVNPDATVVVDDKGNATVTTKDGKTVVIPKADLVKTEADKETAKAGNSINKPVDKLIANKDALTPENIAAIKAKVEAVNPDATVVVDAKGNATVTTPEGKTATIPVTDLVKTEADKETAKAGNNVNKPADKVAAAKEDLADPAKKDDVVGKIKAAILKVNPEGTKVVVDEKGNATVSTPDGKTATIPVEDLLKNPADKDKANAGNKVNTPATKVVVTSPDNKAADEEKIKAEILKVNPGATVVFDTAGNATVTTKDGAVATIPASDLAKDAADLEKADKQDDVKKPVDKTIVKHPDKLTQTEKDAIKAAVEKVNPSDPANPTTVVVDDHGNATVTTPDGKTKVIPASELVKTQDQADGANAGNNVNKPADRVSAKPADLEGADKENLKTKIADAIKAVNPEGTKVFVDDKGNATVTTPEGKTATIPVEDLLKDPDVKESATAGNKVNTPADRVILDKDIAALSPEELAKLKEKIADKVKAINPDATVVVDDKGNATVTTKDGAVATIPAADLLKAKADLTDPAKQPAVKIPVDETVVANKDGLSETEIKAIKKAVESVNPDATVFVDDKGNATVTTPDGKTAVIAADDLVKTQEDVSNDPKAGNLVNKPADRVFVKDGQITDDVKAKIKDKVQRVNPDSTVFVDENGNAIVTTPEGKTVTIPVDDLTKTDADKAKVKAGNKISIPADRVLVKDREHLTAEDIKEIEKNIKAVNPDKDKDNPTVVLFDEKGNATVTVTNPDGTKTTATIPVEDLVKPVAYLTNPAKQDLIKKPVDKVLIANADNIGEDAKKAIEKAVLAVNPKEGTTVVVDDKGNATITTPDGKTFVIPAKDLVKSEEEAKNEKAGNDINKPSDKVVADTTKPLTDEAKKAIVKKIKAVNPDTKAIFVDNEGNATVTLEDGTTATILAKDLVRTEEQAKGPNAGNNVNTPADKVVADPDNLTEENKTAIAENIKSVNPEAKVAFDKYGNATVTTKDGAIATIPVKNLVKTQDEATKPTAGNNVNKPADKVVADPADFNDETKKVAIKKAIEDNIKAVNPGALVAVDDLGNATVTLPNGKTAVIPAKDLTKPSTEVDKPKAGNDIVKPADKTVVKDPAKLTDAEKDAIGAKVAEVNPDAKYIAVDDKGNVTVTLNDGKVAVIPASDLTKTAEEAAKPKAGNDVVKPADKTVVKNPELLTDAEKKAIEDKVRAVNPKGSTVVVDDEGNATVTTPDGKIAVIPAKDLTKSENQATEPNAGNDIVKPADKVVVEAGKPVDKVAIAAKVAAVNPKGSTVVVDDEGNATVTTPEGKTAVIPAKDLTKTAEEAAKPNAGNDVVKPADKTVVANPEQLTDAEKKAITDKVKAVNPGATVVVDDKGNATVTTPEGKTAVIPAADLTKNADAEKAPKAGNDIVKPASKTKVANPEQLKDAEKKAIEDKVKAVNPGAKVVVDDKGNATVTLPNGNTAVIPASDLTKSEKDVNDGKAKDNAVTPAAKTKVANPDSLTPEEKKAIEDKVKAANPGAEVFVDDKGNATVVTKDGNVSVIPSTDLVKVADDAKKDNGGNDANTPAAKTVVKDPANLTDEEKEKVKKAVKAVNPGSTVVVDEKGNATVTKADGTVLNIPSTDLVIPADNLADEAKNAKVKTPAFRILVGDKENLTKDEKEAVKKAIEAVNPGATVVVDDKGNATVTLPDGSTATISKEQLVKDKDDAKGKHHGDNLELDLSKVTVANLASITPEEKAKFQFMILGAITGVEEFDISTLEKTTDDKGNTIYASKDGKVKITIDKDGNATIEKDGNKVLAVNIDKAGNVTIVTKEGKVLAIPRDDAFRQKETPKLPEKVAVADINNLTDAEKAAVKAALIKANPKLKDANITISATGEAIIVYPDGQKVVIPGANLVVGKGSNNNAGTKVTDADSKDKDVNVKAGQRLANTGTTETNTGLAGLGLGILGAFLAAARRRKEK